MGYYILYPCNRSANSTDKKQLNTSTNHNERTQGARRLHNNNGELLNEKLKSSGTSHCLKSVRILNFSDGQMRTRKTPNTDTFYAVYPFGTGKARDIAIGKKLPEKVVGSLIKANKIGNEIYLPFVNGSL